MTFTFNIHNLQVISVTVLVYIIIGVIINRIIIPWIKNKSIKDIEKNPNWIVNKLRKEYYGFEDIDIVVADSPFGLSPCLRLEKHTNKLQLLIPNTYSTNDVEFIGRLALASKLKIKYGVWYPDKTLQWLSILNYLLDGNDINVEATKWEEKPLE